MVNPDEVVLRTTRLILRPMRVADADELYAAVVSQEDVMRWLATGRAGTRAEAGAMCERHVDHWMAHGFGDFAVREGETNAFLGRVGLRSRPEHGVDLGFAMDPRSQGHGYATEAGRACLDLAFGRLGIREVYAFVLPGNEASIATVRRLGAQKAGTVVSSGLHCLRFRWAAPTDLDAREDVP